MKKIWCLFILLVLFKFSNSQIINIDKFDTLSYSKKAKWEGSVSSGIEVDRQKATLYDATTFTDISYQKYKELFIFSGSNRFTYDGENDFLNTGYLHLRWRHNYKNQFHFESYTQYNWDEVIGLKSRIVTGGNIRYSIWHKNKSDVTFATGIMYENEKWIYVESPIFIYHTSGLIKSNNYIKWEDKLSESTNFSLSLFYQSKFNDFLKPRIATNVSIDAEVSKHFSIGLKYTGMYDSNPVVPFFKFYYSISNNLIYNF